MQFDKTKIAIRERAMLEILDLSLHVMRFYAAPMLITFVLGVVPLFVLNHLLIGWMTNVAYEEEFPYGYMWNMTLLIFVEAPLASVFATCYLGQAVFQEKPRVGQVVADVLRRSHRLAWCQVIMRGVAPFCLLYLLIDRYRDYPGMVEAFWIPVFALYCLVLRGIRPFINEIIVLERNQLYSSNPMIQTIKLRSKRLHEPSSGELFSRAIGSLLVGVLLWMGVYGVFLFGAGIFLNSWRQGPFMITWCFPLSVWVVAFYFVFVRFLSYLDLRIRQEGWEVELKLRAEAAKLANRFT